MKKIMMIGCGAMGGAILSGCLSKGLWTKEEVYIKASTEKSTVEKAERYGVSAASLKDIGEADFVLLAVKPDIIPFVLEEINPYRPRQVISVAAAVTAADLGSWPSRKDAGNPCHAEYSRFGRGGHDSHYGRAVR